MLTHPARRKVSDFADAWAGFLGATEEEQVRVLEPGGCTAYRSHSNRNMLTHLARMQAAAAAAAAAGQSGDAEGEYENGRVEVDQIVGFFEREYDGKEEAFWPYALEPDGCTAFRSDSNSNILIHPARACRYIDAEEREELNAQRIAYYNCTNSLDHQVSP